MIDNYPAERAILISTKHVPYCYDFGSLLYASDVKEGVYIVLVDTEEKMLDAPKWLVPIAKYAYDRKCQFIIFDPLAPEIEELPIGGIKNMTGKIEEREATACGLKLSFYRDDEPKNPRDDDNVGIMVCEDYTDVDINKFKGLDEVEKHIRQDLGAIVILPLYACDHCKVPITTEAREWSSKIGFIYATEKSANCLEKEDNMSRQEWLTQVKEWLIGEVNIYNAYLQGNAYGWKVEDEKGEIYESERNYLVATEEDEYFLMQEGKKALQYYAGERRMEI